MHEISQNLNRAKNLKGQPLGGIRVLDFSHVLAGPMCTRLLVDLGADVLRVESTKRADTPWRSASDPELKRTLAYVMVHRGKKSITIDLKNEAGAELARRLAAVADVVVENFSAGVMHRLGLDYACLAPLNPRLIFLSMSGYGHYGPRKDWTSMNTNLQAYSGMMTVTDKEENPPVAISNSWMDYVGGLHGCYSVIQALTQREKDGKGRNIDLAQFESGVGTLGALLLAGIVDGTGPKRMGNRSASAAPQGCYPCSGEDQWCAISVESDEHWRSLAQCIGDPDLMKDERFETVTGRLRHHDEIDRWIEAWTRSRTPNEAEKELKAIGVPAQHMRRVNEILPPNEDSIFRLRPGKPRPTLLSGLPFSFAPHNKQTFGEAPRLGEHTEWGLKSWLGLDDSGIVRLREAGALA
ncbi:MAG TPA: CoA transferase [Xanthobacteraceae bacterium]|jgi:benzylsuccinate CoA-transferase BbsF subunit